MDWALAAAVLYVLLPKSDLSFLGLLGAFLAAQLLGLASHVPGGVGVFEGLMVILLKPFLSSAQLLPALVVYRLVYYVLPLAWRSWSWSPTSCANAAGRPPARAPSSAGSAKRSRRASWPSSRSWPGPAFSSRAPLRRRRAASPGSTTLLPLGVVEASHFLGSIVGAGLLLVSQGLSRRLDAAYYLAAGGIALGIAASLFKGADFEEATLLALLLVVLWRARPAFDRRAALLETRFSPAGSWRSWRRWALRSGWASSPSSTSSIPMSCGGSSSWGRRPRAFCGHRWGRPWRSPCSASHG